jgi:hypothetical protein
MFCRSSLVSDEPPEDLSAINEPEPPIASAAGKRSVKEPGDGQGSFFEGRNHESFSNACEVEDATAETPEHHVVRPLRVMHTSIRGSTAIVKELERR